MSTRDHPYKISTHAVSVYLCLATQEWSVLHLRTKFEADSSISSKVIRVPKFRNWVTSPKPRPFRGQIAIYIQELTPVCQYAKFEEHSLSTTKIWHIFLLRKITTWPRDLDLWPFDLESGVQVTCDVGYLCANFSLPRPLCSRLRPDVRDRQTSDR